MKVISSLAEMHAAFDSASIPPEVTAYNDKIVEMAGKDSAELAQISFAEIRQRRKSGNWGYYNKPMYVSSLARTRKISGPGGDIELREFQPENSAGVYLHLHGGGMAVGGAEEQDQWLEEIATEVGITVVSVEYRLAPEDPYPAGADDCEAACLWLIENAGKEYGSDRIIIGGESGGAYLSAVTIRRLREKHGYAGLKGAVLTYGLFDMLLTPSAANWGEEPLVLNTPAIRYLVKNYAADGVDLRDPDLSPLFGNLADFPPALLTVGTLDPLLDDTLFMYMRLLAAGCAAELAVYPGAVHGFDIANTPIVGKAARNNVKQFLRRNL